MGFRDRGLEIKTREQIDLMRVAGRLVGETLELLRTATRPGVTTLELDTLGSNTCTIREGATTIVATSPSNGPHDGLVFIYVDFAQAEVEYLFVVETQ